MVSLSKINVKNNKHLKIICLIIAAGVVAADLYIAVVGKNIETKMRNYLEQENYTKANIQYLKVKPSFLNKVLSYNEVGIAVVYADEAKPVYCCTVKDGEIAEAGVSTKSDKWVLKH